MKHYLLTSSLLVGLSAAALAQTPAAPPATPGPALQTPAAVTKTGVQYKRYLADRYAGDKQALAVVHLFARKQRGGLLWLAGGAGTTGLLAGLSGSHPSDSGGTYTVSVSPVGYLIFGGLPVFIGARKLVRFSNGQLYEALQMHDLTHSLPGYVEQRLRDRDYR